MKNLFLSILLFIFSCQPVEKIDPIVFDNSQLEKIVFSAEKIEIYQLYEITFSDPYIDHSLLNPPVERLKSWMNENIVALGSENKLVINILDASIIRKEIFNEDAKKYEEKEIYSYEIFFLIEYNLFDDDDFLLATTSVENYRSTTSGKHISLQEKELIIDELTLLSLKDLTKESKKLIKQYMFQYLI